MARYILFTILCFILLTFLMTTIKGVLRRAMNLTSTQKEPRTPSTPPVPPPSSEELYRKNGIVVLKGETPHDD